MSHYIVDALGVKDLLFEWTSRTIRGRYQQSVLGWSWAIILPAAQAAVFTVVFTLFVPVETDGLPYGAFAYTALVPWTLMSSSLTDMSNSLVENMSLVTKIYFPRQVLPFAALLARLMDFAIAFCLLVPLILYFDLPVSPAAWFYLPLILGIHLMLISGIGLACSALNVFVRDVKSLLMLVVQLWFYASPVVYPMETVPESIRPYYALNPMAGIIEGYRDVLLRGTTPGPELLTAALIAGSSLVLGWAYFRYVEPEFADII